MGQRMAWESALRPDSVDELDFRLALLNRKRLLIFVLYNYSTLLSEEVSLLRPHAFEKPLHHSLINAIKLPPTFLRSVRSPHVYLPWVQSSARP